MASPRNGPGSPTSTSFVSSIQISFNQVLWRELKGHVISFKGIDAAFAATGSPLSFINGEMLTKVRVASALAFVSWLILISSLIAPATLNVQPELRNNTQSMNIPTLHISDASNYQRFSYAVNGTHAGLQKYLGPRTVIQRLSIAASTTGEILSLSPPAANATYQQTFFGPYIQCSESTEEVSREIDRMIDRAKRELDPSIELVAMSYFAAVPALSNLRNTSYAEVQVANLTEADGALYASNQAWMSIPQFEPSRDFSTVREPRHITCELYNASYKTTFAWLNGQGLRVVDRTLLHPVAYPANATTQPDSEVAEAYSSVFLALSQQITGSMGFYRDRNGTNDATQGALAGQVYSDLSTDIAQTVLVGAADLDSHFKTNHMLGKAADDPSTFSDQRLLDMSYARNRSLGTLISELSSNITLSLITDPLLASAMSPFFPHLPTQLLTQHSPSVPTDVTVTAPVTVYTYASRNLLLAYGLAGAAALIANLLGGYAFHASGVSHDVSFSSIACSTHALHFKSRLRAHERLGALPLDSEVAGTLLKFHLGDSGRWGFGTADEV